PYDVNPRRRGELEEARRERHVALLVGEADARDGAERVAHRRLLHARVGLAHGERERSDAAVVARHEPEHPAGGLVALEGRVELLVEVAEAAEKGDRRRGLEGLAERGLDDLLLVGLVDPERLAVADDRLAIGRIVVPAHPARLLEGDPPVRLDRARERRRLDRLVKLGAKRPRGLVARLQAPERLVERVGGVGRARGQEPERGEDEEESERHRATASLPRAHAQAAGEQRHRALTATGRRPSVAPWQTAARTHRTRMRPRHRSPGRATPGPPPGAARSSPTSPSTARLG